jgi:hypothetical protein
MTHDLMICLKVNQFPEHKKVKEFNYVPISPYLNLLSGEVRFCYLVTLCQ